MELVPHEKLEGDLPTVLIEGCAHWLNLSTFIMEIRPLDTLWEASSENWRIDCTSGHYRMWKGHEHLVDIQSQSWGMISNLLRPLCTPQDIIVSVMVDSRKPSLSVFLPHYDLSFYVDEDGDLRSRSIRDMVYDEDQSIGTLFGLVNQLVLRPKIKDANAVELVPRCILIPEGDVSFRTDGHHVRIEIATQRSGLKRATYQIYRADTDLCCLIGNGTLRSKLYCAYLHALTSGCSADPLTGRSGTEEALSVLRSASCWSTIRLSSCDAELLSLIASICPSRTWYCDQYMQEVKWRNRLPASSQNHDLYMLAKEIKEHYEKVQLFHENQPIPLFRTFPLQDHHLVKRGARQAAYLFPLELSRQPSRENFDVQYPSRDLTVVASGEHRAFDAASYVSRRTATSTVDIWEMVQSWGTTVHENASLSLQYDRSWLAPNLPLIWLKTYYLLRKSDERKWFQLLFSLPAMAYASSNLRNLVPVFVAFASHSQFLLEDPPHYHSYHISTGYYPSLVLLRDFVVDCAFPLARSPERLVPAVPGEDLYELQLRQREMYGDRIHRDANATAQELFAAWPCKTPPQCSLDPKLYDVVDFTSQVRRHFSSRFPNFELKEHVTRVQLILNNLHYQASPTPDTPPYAFHPSQHTPCAPWPHMVDQLFSRPAPPLRAGGALLRYTVDIEYANTCLRNCRLLHQLIATVAENAVNQFQHQYVAALHTSARCFEGDTSLISHRATRPPTAEALLDYYARCRAGYIEALHHVQQCLGAKSHSEQAVVQSGQWPRITAYALFQCLASNSSIILPDDWRRCLIQLTLLALELQRARRLLLLHFHSLHEELYNELQNDGCNGWDAETHPDWLLIQVCVFASWMYTHAQAVCFAYISCKATF